jgi:hypothetical protein
VLVTRRMISGFHVSGMPLLPWPSLIVPFSVYLTSLAETQEVRSRCQGGSSPVIPRARSVVKQMPMAGTGLEAGISVLRPCGIERDVGGSWAHGE